MNKFRKLFGSLIISGFLVVSSITSVFAAGTIKVGGTITPQWGFDLHNSITYSWAIGNGFTIANATTIATADWTTDTSTATATAGRLEDTGPLSQFPYTHDGFHFNTNSNAVSAIGSTNYTRMINYNIYFNSAVTKYNAATSKYNNDVTWIKNNYSVYNPVRATLLATAYTTRGNQRSLALNDLGTALHCRQDIFAHGNVQSMAQHDAYKVNGTKIIDNLSYNINWSSGRVTKYADRSMSNPRYANTNNVTYTILRLVLPTMLTIDNMKERFL